MASNLRIKTEDKYLETKRVLFISIKDEVKRQAKQEGSFPVLGAAGFPVSTLKVCAPFLKYANCSRRDWCVGNVGLHVLGCRVDILGTNCKKLLKVEMNEQ